MITPEVLQRIRRIELKTRRLVDSAFGGVYHTIFKGRGIAFDSVRPYELGDDVRDIDWNITARMGEPYIKQYTEERELTVLLLMDISGSFMFGSVNRPKRDIAAELGAVLALSAIKNNDTVGLLLFSDQVEAFIPPRKGRKHVLHLIRDLVTTPASDRQTDLSLALKTADRILKRRSIIFVISDFFVDPRQFERDLLILSRRHDVVAVVTHDPLERHFEDVGLIVVEDAETKEVLSFDSGRKAWQKQYRLDYKVFDKTLSEILNRAGIDRINLDAKTDYVVPLMEFFKQRERRIQSR